MRSTQTRSSTHSWAVGNWSRCSRTCDAGVRSRSVVCQRRVSAAEEKALDDSACPQPRPPVLEACQGPMCPPEWAALEWSEVSFRLSSHPTHSLSTEGAQELGCLCGKAAEAALPQATVTMIKRGALWVPRLLDLGLVWPIAYERWSQPRAVGKACR